MDRSRNTVSNYLKDEKIHCAKYSKIFTRLNQITDQLCKIELFKPEIEKGGPIVIGFFILQHAKLRILEP